MNHLHERVALPDPESQPLVHPLDLAEARGPYRRAWLFSLLASAEVLLLVAAAAWWAAQTYLAPALALMSTGAIAWLAQRHHAADAWGHIPRRRQDVDRPDPWGWATLRLLVTSVSLVAGTALILAGLDGQGFDRAVRTYATGAALGLGVALVVTTAVTWWPRRPSVALAAVAWAGLCVVVGSVVVWFAGWVPRSPDLLTAVLGAAVLLGVHAAWWLVGVTRSRR